MGYSDLLEPMMTADMGMSLRRPLYLNAFTPNHFRLSSPLEPQTMISIDTDYLLETLKQSIRINSILPNEEPQAVYFAEKSVSWASSRSGTKSRRSPQCLRLH